MNQHERTVSREVRMAFGRFFGANGLHPLIYIKEIAKILITTYNRKSKEHIKLKASI
jgi:hypothetical protein